MHGAKLGFDADLGFDLILATLQSSFLNSEVILTFSCLITIQFRVISTL